MAVDPEVRKNLEDQLRKVCNLRSRAMFGGVGFYADDLFFALADDGVLYFKVDDLNLARFEEAGCSPFIPWPGAAPMGYWSLPKGVLEDESALREWVESSVAVAQRAQTKKKPRKK